MADPIESKILTLLGSYYPELDCRPGSPFYEFVIRPMVFLWQKHQQGAEELLSANNLSEPSTMAEEDLDRMMTRYFETRKRGEYVYGVIRLFFKTQKDYELLAGTGIEISGGRTYEALGTYVSRADMKWDEVDGVYYDFGVVSTGTGNFYNAFAYEPIEPSSIASTIATDVTKGYFVANTTDGGVIEDNITFYNRVRSSLSLKNLSTYRGVRRTLLEEFTIRELTVIGLKDPEMRRDLIDLPEVGVVHRGGCADFYVHMEPISLLEGYNAPLGFPYTFSGVSIETNPLELMQVWNSYMLDIVDDVDTFKRGSVYESIPGLNLDTDMHSLTSNVKVIHDFVASTDYETLHCDNLVRQAWPLLVIIDVAITDSRGPDAIPIAKTALFNYINTLPIGKYPKTADAVHALKNATIAYVHLPMSLNCYYLNEYGWMERIGSSLVREPSSSTLRPVETDSLQFAVDSKSQISARTCRWITLDPLIRVTVR